MLETMKKGTACFTFDAVLASDPIVRLLRTSRDVQINCGMTIERRQLLSGAHSAAIVTWFTPQKQALFSNQGR